MSRFQTQSLSFPICQMRIPEAPGGHRKRCVRSLCVGAPFSAILAEAWLYLKITQEAFRNDQNMRPRSTESESLEGGGGCQASVFFFPDVLNTESHRSNPSQAGCPGSWGWQGSLPRGGSWKLGSGQKYVSGMHVINELADTPSGISLL